MPADGDRRAPGRAAGAGQRRHAFGQPAQRHLGLEPGQRRAQAVVDAGGEGEVAGCLRAVEVRRIGFGEDGRVPAGAGQQQRHPVTGSEPLSGELGLDVGDPVGHLDRRVEPQHLLGGGTGHAGVVPQPGPQLRAVQQRRDRVPDQVHGRLEAGDEQQVAHDHEVVLGHPPVALGRDHRADQVFPGLAATLLDRPGQGRVEPAGGSLQGHQMRRGADTVERGRDRRAVPGHGDGVRPVKAEQRGDDGDRQWCGVSLDEVERAGAARLGQQPVGGVLDQRTVSLDGPRRECRRRQLPQPAVIGRITVQHAEIHLGIRNGDAGRPDPEVPAAQHRLTAVVPRGDPGAGPRPYERPLLPQSPIDRVRVGDAGPGVQASHRLPQHVGAEPAVRPQPGHRPQRGAQHTQLTAHRDRPRRAAAW